MIDMSDSIISGLSQAATHPLRYAAYIIRSSLPHPIRFATIAYMYAAQDSINRKFSSLSSFCSSYPMTTFISSNRQMNRKLTRDILKNEESSAKK